MHATAIVWQSMSHTTTVCWYHAVSIFGATLMLITDRGYVLCYGVCCALQEFLRPTTSTCSVCALTLLWMTLRVARTWWWLRSMQSSCPGDLTTHTVRSDVGTFLYC